MSDISKSIWAISVLATLVASLVLFIPYEYVAEQTGISLLAFIAIICVVEICMATIVAYLIYSLRKVRIEKEEKRDGDWDYYPQDID